MRGDALLEGLPAGEPFFSIEKVSPLGISLKSETFLLRCGFRHDLLATHANPQAVLYFYFIIVLKRERSISQIVSQQCIEDGHMASNPMQVEGWKAFIHQYLGDQGIAKFEAMTAGALITPEPDVFGPGDSPNAGRFCPTGHLRLHVG